MAELTEISLHPVPYSDPNVPDETADCTSPDSVLGVLVLEDDFDDVVAHARLPLVRLFIKKLDIEAVPKVSYPEQQLPLVLTLWFLASPAAT